MFKVLLFLAALVLSLFIVLYSELTWQLIIVYGKKKLVLNLWFAFLVILLAYLTVHWVFRQFGKTFRLPSIWRAYRWERKNKELQYARGQALMYALGGNYQAALGHLPFQKNLELSDLILVATWLNRCNEIQKLDQVLSQIHALNKIPDGWMVWFRAYLLFERGRGKLATDLLLDAIESGIYSKKIVVSFCDYADPKIHYLALLKHYPLLSRYASEDVFLPKVLEGALVYFDQKISEKDWEGLEQGLSLLPKKIRKDKMIQYYWVKNLLHQSRKDKLLATLMQTSFQDDRLIPLLADMDIGLEKKIEIIIAALDREPNNKNLRYLLSYLHAQAGSVDDTVKMLESAIFKAN